MVADYPELSSFRDFYIVSAFIIATLSLQILVFSISQSLMKRIEAKRTSYVFLAFGFLYSGYLLGFSLLLATKLWVPEDLVFIFIKIVWAIIIIGLSLFFIIIEWLYELTLKFPFALSFLSFMSFLLLLFTNYYSIFYQIGVLIIFALVIAQFGFLLYYLHRAPSDKKSYFRWLIIGTVFLWSGILPFTALFKSFMYLEIVILIFVVLVLCGEILILYTMVNIEIFSLTDWKNNMLELYIISQMPQHFQRVLYHLNFNNDPSFNTPNALISGGILGLEQVLTNFSNLGTHVKIVEQEATDILLEYRSMYVVCLIVRFKLRIHERILKEISEKFSKFYDNVLPKLDFSSPFTTTLFNGFDKQVKKIIDEI